MKRYALLLPFLLFLSCKEEPKTSETPQYFEGVITFVASIESKNPMLTPESMERIQGDTMKFYVRNGDYRIWHNGGDIETMYYDHKSNLLHTLSRGADSATATNCRVRESEVRSFALLEKDTSIAGHSCRCVEMITEDMTKRICYDSTLAVNPDHFVNHTWDHADIYYSKTRSVFLTYYRETPVAVIRYDAVKVEPRKLEDTEIKYQHTGKKH